MTFASVAVLNLRRSAGLVQQPTVVCVPKAVVGALLTALPVLRYTVVLLLVTSAVRKLAEQAAELYVIMAQVLVHAVLKHMAVT
jgi:hypothetical protein